MIIGGRADEEDDEHDDDDNVDDDDIVGWWDAQLTEETLWLLARFFFCHQISHPLHLPPNIFIFPCQQIFHPFLGPNILSFTFDQILYCLWSTKNGSTKMYLKFASYILSLQDTATNAVNCASRLGAKRQLGERLVVVLSQSWDGYNDDDDDRWGWVVVWSQGDSQRRGSNFQTARWGLVGAGGSEQAFVCLYLDLQCALACSLHNLLHAFMFMPSHSVYPWAPSHAIVVGRFTFKPGTYIRCFTITHGETLHMHYVQI